eukprot:TRINITY_DN1762_c0_g1_i1.p1 TRINITY_DN1762_c0_g1~~TRINITY_DN1762_c0_g1_i1.p1  ORF type:complete len:117 (+),score=13.92 TRINITY_DN1762_c0_g1_i1:27-353(+)
MARQLREVFLRAEPAIKSSYIPEFHRFRVLGPDFMLSEDMSLHLIEINTNPGFDRKGPEKKDIMQEVFIRDSVKIVDHAFERRINEHSFGRLDYGHFKIVLDQSSAIK